MRTAQLQPSWPQVRTVPPPVADAPGFSGNAAPPRHVYWSPPPGQLQTSSMRIWQPHPSCPQVSAVPLTTVAMTSTSTSRQADVPADARWYADAPANESGD